MGAFYSHEEAPTAQDSCAPDLQETLSLACESTARDTRVPDSTEKSLTVTEEQTPVGCGKDHASGLFCERLFACLHPGGDKEGMALQINSTEGVEFENDLFSGRILFMHRPDPEPERWTWRERFEGKTRCWEFRLQGTFKTDPGEMYFAAELSEPMSIGWASIITMKAILNFAYMLASIRGIDFDYNWYLTEFDNGDVLRPHFTFPLIAADIAVRTPAGEKPPLITAPLEATPLADKIATSLKAGDTYTFGFWTKYLHFARWELVNVPLGLGGSLDAFIGKQPIDLAIYGLRTSKSEGDLRAESNKIVLARIVLTHTASGKETIDAIRQKHDMQNSIASTPAKTTTAIEQRIDRQQPTCCFPWWRWLVAD
eukprot:TRINITY_DN92169_c0_g1_i1.p1 TRINITY_DN92169_c0_g1~~TRINITY_DN92169_c0_g1_i1.p1  ORF type:complete len:381 (-),score=36.74 TRINITY_DN92169_c0_g1_i1:125-1234(-)